jgi:hypothetical protein
VALGQRSRAIFDFHKRQRLTLVGVRLRMLRFLHDISSTSKARGTSREPLFFCLDQQNQFAIWQ